MKSHFNRWNFCHYNNVLFAVKPIADDSEVTGVCYKSQKRNQSPHQIRVSITKDCIIFENKSNQIIFDV